MKAFKEEINKLFDEVIDGSNDALFVTYINGQPKIEGNIYLPLNSLTDKQLKQVTLDVMKEKANEYSTIIWRMDPYIEDELFVRCAFK